MASTNEVICSRKSVKALPLSSVNHISRNCRNLEEACNFYKNLLGFVQIQRPGSFDFDGIWLFNYGIGIHLLQCCGDKLQRKDEIDPRADHLSFQCAADIGVVEQRLQEHGIKYVRRQVEEGGVYVDQLFFHDPDGFMIEVCNCDNLPVVPVVNVPPAIHMPQEQCFSASCFSPSLTFPSPVSSVAL